MFIEKGCFNSTCYLHLQSENMTWKQEFNFKLIDYDTIHFKSKIGSTI